MSMDQTATTLDTTSSLPRIYYTAGDGFPAIASHTVNAGITEILFSWVMNNAVTYVPKKPTDETYPAGPAEHTFVVHGTRLERYGSNVLPLGGFILGFVTTRDLLQITGESNAGVAARKYRAAVNDLWAAVADCLPDKYREGARKATFSADIHTDPKGQHFVVCLLHYSNSRIPITITTESMEVCMKGASWLVAPGNRKIVVFLGQEQDAHALDTSVRMGVTNYSHTVSSGWSAYTGLHNPYTVVLFSAQKQTKPRPPPSMKAHYVWRKWRTKRKSCYTSVEEFRFARALRAKFFGFLRDKLGIGGGLVRFGGYRDVEENCIPDLNRVLEQLANDFPLQWRGLVKAVVEERKYDYLDVERLAWTVYGCKPYTSSADNLFMLSLTLFCTPPPEKHQAHKRWLQALAWANTVWDNFEKSAEEAYERTKQ